MKYYVVTKNVTLSVKGKCFRKDSIISFEDIGEASVKRYLEKGYIKPLSGDTAEAVLKSQPIQPNPQPEREQPFYLTTEEYLAPEQVNRLIKSQLVEYAAHIGLTSFKADVASADLKKLINSYIADAEAEAEEDEEDES